MKRTLITLLATGGLLGLAGCGTDTSSSPTPTPTALSGTVNAAGSSALAPLVRAAKEQFEGANPNVTVNVALGGSFQGLSQVSTGAVDIGDSDVPASAAKALQNGDQLVDHRVAVVAFVIIVNPNVQVDSLTQQQAQDIISGKVTNWKDVGGQDLKIQVVLRPKTSGTRYTFKKVVLQNVDETTSPAATQDSTNTVKQLVAQTPGAVSYIALGAADATVKKVKYNGIEASADNVKNGSYPIWAHEHMYTKGPASGVVKAFIDFILSSGFQHSDALKKLGFVPVKDVSGSSAAES